MDQDPAAFEQRRNALELERLRLERQKVSLEAKLKRRELAATKTTGWRDLFANPLALAIVGGALTLVTSMVTSRFNASESIQAETVKARQGLEANLIEKFVDNPDPKKVRANLQFLVDVGLVPDYAGSLKTFLSRNPDSALPNSSNSESSKLESVHSNNDAIDLVISLEGGFVNDPKDPESASKYGITRHTLSRFLGKPASVDDVRNLSMATARAIYTKFYLTGAVVGISSPHVTAAYLHLATNTGAARANRLFEAAIGKIDKQPVDEDGVLTPGLVERINAADPDLLIETLNCEAAKFYETLPMFDVFGSALVRQLRVFSPAVLKGVCPELQGKPAPAAPANDR